MWGSVGPVQRPMLTGTHECNLDNRFRLAIPARVRAPFLGERVMVGWWLDPCVMVAPVDHWTALIDGIFGSMSVLDDDGRELKRFLLSGVWEQELDRQGRILLPQELREHASLGPKVKVVGHGDFLEVWDPDLLDERRTALHKEGVSNRANRVREKNAGPRVPA